MKKKPHKPARRHQPMGVALRTETRREIVARLLVLSWSVERIARKLSCSTSSVHLKFKILAIFRAKFYVGRKSLILVHW